MTDQESQQVTDLLAGHTTLSQSCSSLARAFARLLDEVEASGVMAPSETEGYQQELTQTSRLVEAQRQVAARVREALSHNSQADA